MARERSRSRDDDRPIWGNPNPALPHDHFRRHMEPYMPGLRNSRRVLLLIDINQTKQLLTERRDDSMDATSNECVPDLRAPEELALFTYSCLLKPCQIQITSVSDLLCCIGEYIYKTWGSYVEPDDMDLRWSDCTGDTFILRNHQIISKLLAEHRPHWARAQETGTQRHLVAFRNTRQPYIRRLSCHKALPNRNVLP